MAAPDDPIGTVRAAPGVLAIRAPSTSFHPDLEVDGDELSWFIIDIGAGEQLAELDIEEINDLLALWPIAYQP